jgi:Uma2 family endonuclease
LLLIEVSDSTVKYDRDVKIPLYAEAEVPEVWLVNLPRQVLEVYTQAEKGKYKIVRRYAKNETIALQTVAPLEVKVSDILA